ncbi:MAG: FtsX-like permease family protein [bacterium]|nr:FtsX-like permease family protein [bacterium]
MQLLFKIAWRNILRHKGKSLVIGIILFLGSLIMTLGNGVISGMDKGISENIVNRFTGHVVLVSTNQEQDNVLFSHMGKSVEVIYGYTNIRKILDRQPYIDKYLPTARGMAMALSEDAEPAYTILLGVKFEDYNRMFENNVEIIEGHVLKNDQRGCLITSESRKSLYDYTSSWLVPENTPLIRSNLSPEARSNQDSLILKTNVVIMGFGDDDLAMDIRVPIKGIFKYKRLNKLWEYFNLIDIESFRECFSYVTGADAAVSLPAEKQTLLSMEGANLDNLFDNTVTSVATKAGGYDFQTMKHETRRKNVKVNIDAGAYNMVLVKLEKDIRLNQAVSRLNKELKKQRVDARAITWKKAAGQVADMATIVRGSLFGFVLFIFFVAIIIIMNTLSMAAIERTSEIGMMRAVGATKGFIANMFIAETSLLSLFFGGLGILTGIILIKIVASLNISTTNDILQLLYGGDTFQPQLNLGDIISGILQLVVVTVIAVLYPVKVAKQITPLEAIARD